MTYKNEDDKPFLDPYGRRHFALYLRGWVKWATAISMTAMPYLSVAGTEECQAASPGIVCQAPAPLGTTAYDALAQEYLARTHAIELFKKGASSEAKNFKREQLPPMLSAALSMSDREISDFATPVVKQLFNEGDLQDILVFLRSTHGKALLDSLLLDNTETIPAVTRSAIEQSLEQFAETPAGKKFVASGQKFGTLLYQALESKARPVTTTPECDMLVAFLPQHISSLEKTSAPGYFSYGDDDETFNKKKVFRCRMATSVQTNSSRVLDKCGKSLELSTLNQVRLEYKKSTTIVDGFCKK